MSKLSPLGQSMASLFTPESERIRSSTSKDGVPGAIKMPGMKRGPTAGQKSGDSLGNPNSPGYEPWGKKKEKAPEAEAAPEETKGPAGTVIEAPTQGPELIRLSIGWDRILLTQKKLCEKAKGLFTLLEGPEKYRSQRKGKTFALKSRGCIVDLDSQTVQSEKDAAAKAKKETA